ncbi:hypothetical protein ERUR111494_03210 [Erysipelothrix urinaevulpis]
MTDLAYEAGYARPYLSAILNRNRRANHALLNHLLETLDINYKLEIQQLETLYSLLDMFQHSLTYKTINRTSLYQRIEPLSYLISISLVLQNRYHILNSIYKIQMNLSYSLDQVESMNDSLYYWLLCEHYFLKQKPIQLMNHAENGLSCPSKLYIFNYYMAYAHFLNNDFISSLKFLEVSEYNALKNHNYQRIIDIQLLRMKITVMNKDFNNSFKIYEQLRNLLSYNQVASDSLDQEWFKSLIYLDELDDAIQLRHNLSKHSSSTKLANMILDLKLNLESSEIITENDFEASVLVFIRKIKEQTLSTSELEKNIDFICNAYYHDYLVKCLTCSYLASYLLTARRYKSLSVVLQKFPQLKIGNHNQ